jgi:predicted dehydrogenase
MRGTGRGGGWYQANREAAGGGILIETGSHLVDQVFQILGVESVEVKSYRPIGHGGIDEESRVTATVSTAGHLTVPVRFALSSLNDIPNGIYIRFADATVALEGTVASPVRLLDRRGSPVAEIGGDRGVILAYQAFYLEWADFLEQCRTGKPGRMAAASARPSVELVDICYKRMNGAERGDWEVAS